MFDLKTDNQLMSMVAGLAAGAILLAGAAGVAAADVREGSVIRTASARVDRLADRVDDSTERAAAERRRALKRAKDRTTQSATVQGVPRTTLEAIAACESGGDPTAVNAAGYYGKYQFSIGTWQAVGGTGNPAEASEGEQDLRAAILYNRSGPGQWPICGV